MPIPARCFLLVCGLGFCGAPAQSPAGEWRGAIEVPGNRLEVVVVLRQEGSEWTGTIDIPAQGAADLPLRPIRVAGSEIEFAIAGVPGEPTFRGDLDADGTAIRGVFTQGGQRFPFALRSATAAAGDLMARLEGFAAWLEAAREAWHVPGCAVAVVRGSEVLATYASGHRSREPEQPATADTLFAIGSSSKAFTTFVLATLVDEGAIEWDEPVRRWLPDFALADEIVAARLTPRDLVTHRSGMPRHDAVWYASADSRAQLVQRMRHLPLRRDLRVEFQYNNLMFLAAGVLAERVAGANWEQLVRQRILDPLGMARTNFSVRDLAADQDHAEPFRRDDGVVRRIPFRDITTVGPAGSINSSVREMAQWLALHLGKGERSGRRLLQATTAAELLEPQMIASIGRPDPMLVPVGYALGWFVDVYRGHRRVGHGGNIDGFSAMVTLLPDAGFGFVVLANLDSSPLPELVVRRLADQLLQLDPRDWSAEALARRAARDAGESEAREKGAAERRQDAAPSRDLAEFCGDYEHPGYGVMTVRPRAQGGLDCEFHGIRAPLEHWHFDVFRIGKYEDPTLQDTKVQFTSSFDGEVDGVRIPIEPSLPAVGFARLPDAELRDPVFLRRLTGTYSLQGQPVTVALRGARLVVSLPGQFHELEPRRDRTFALRGVTGYSVRFVLDGAGQVQKVRFVQPEGVFDAERRPE